MKMNPMKLDEIRILTTEKRRSLGFISETSIVDDIMFLKIVSRREHLIRISVEIGVICFQNLHIFYPK